MKNFKKVVALTLALVMVLSTMTTAFAATNTAKAETLNALGLFEGTSKEEFVPALDDVTTASQAMVLIGRALQWPVVEGEVSGFTDVPAWAEKYVAYAVAQGITEGVDAEAKLFGDDIIDGKRMVTWFLAAAGYDKATVWADVDTAAAEQGMTVPAGNLRDDVVAVIYAGLMVTPVGETMTIIEKIVGDDEAKMAIAVAAALLEETPEVLAVESVTSSNLSTITVVFNKEVDEDTAEVAANYDITGTATLGADMKTVTLELTTAATPQDEITLTIKDVEDADGTAIVEVEKTIEMFDATIPAVLSVELTGPKSFEIMFSESMKTTGTVKVNNGVYAATPTLDGSKVKVALGASLVDGDYTVEVSGSTDHANYAVKTTELTLTYVKDTADVTVVVDKSSQTSVTLKFNKEINVKDLVEADFYHSYSGYTPDSVKDADGVDMIAVVADTYKDTLVLEFTTNPLPAGNVTLTVSDDNVVDAWGNEMAADAKLAVAIVVDVTAPTITKVEATDEDTIVVTFSEDVTPGTLADNFVIKDGDAEEVSQTYTGSSAYADNAQTLELSSKLDGGTYSITVKDVEDKALSANELAEVTLTFSVSDKTAATVESAIVVEAADEVADTTDDAYIYVTFSEDMNVTDITNVDMYQLGGVALDDDAKAELFGSNKKVKITVPDTTSLIGVVLTVGQVADAAGNKLVALATAETIVADVAPVVTAIKSIEVNKIEITVNGVLTEVAAGGITVDANGSTSSAAAVAFVVKDGETTITATLDGTNVLANPDDLVNEVTIVAEKLKSETGKYVAATDVVAGGVTPTEGVTPEFQAPANDTATAAQVAAAAGNNVITLEFDEDIAVVSLSVTDFVVTYDGDVLTAQDDYQIADVGATNTITLTINLTDALVADKSIVVKVAGAKYTKDLAGNKIEDFEHTYKAK